MDTITYHSNNSGGSWWLNDADWEHLEAAGWTVEWFADPDNAPSFISPDANGRWLGALATQATKATDDPDAAIAEWERITNQSSAEEGCNCCGEPHSFEVVTEDGTSRRSEVVVTSTERVWS